MSRLRLRSAPRATGCGAMPRRWRPPSRPSAWRFEQRLVRACRRLIRTRVGLADPEPVHAGERTGSRDFEAVPAIEVEELRWLGKSLREAVQDRRLRNKAGKLQFARRQKRLD